MRNWFLAAVLMLVAGTSMAGDSGLYYDELRNGEGILMLVNDETVVVYFFTYGAHECYYEDVIENSNGKDCDYNGQRWFYGVIEPEEEEPTPESSAADDLEGTLYITHGINYPEGEPHDFIPFVHNVGENIAIGTFGMRRNLGGWLMDVAPNEVHLDVDDPVFERIFKFETQLFEVDETGIDPK